MFLSKIKMKGYCEHSIFMVLILSSTLSTGSCIRTLKDGPMIGPDSREYKVFSQKTFDEAAVEKPVGRPHSGSSTVHLQCTETTMVILIKADLYNSRYVSPGELFLGQGRSEQKVCQAVPVSDTEYVIEVELHDCGSHIMVVDDSIIYMNKLVFLPVTMGHGITRMTSAVVPVACRYKRMHVVSTSNIARATLLPSTSSKISMEHSDYSLKLMTDDWKRERSSNVFLLGDILHLQASYDVGHGPRRLFIDSCVVTLEPHVTSVPRYYFIDNHGCLVDAKDPGSNARFLSRRKADMLQLQLDAFMFNRDTRNSIFITCHLKAANEKHRISPTSKACNYTNSRWKNVDGNDEVCRCCENTCAASRPQWFSKTSQSRTPTVEDLMAFVTLGPVIIMPSK